jgi:hypothetical protein
MAAAARYRGRTEREAPTPQNDIYTGLLVLSLAAMVLATLFLFIDFLYYGSFSPQGLPEIPAVVQPAPPGSSTTQPE